MRSRLRLFLTLLCLFALSAPMTAYAAKAKEGDAKSTKAAPKKEKASEAPEKPAPEKKEKKSEPAPEKAAPEKKPPVEEAAATPEASAPAPEPPAPAPEAPAPEPPAPTPEPPAPAPEAPAPTPEPPVPAPAVILTAPETCPDPLEEVWGEMTILNERVEALQRSFDAYLGGIVADLQAENDRLRDELRELHQMRIRDAATPSPSSFPASSSMLTPRPGPYAPQPLAPPAPATQSMTAPEPSAQSAGLSGANPDSSLQTVATTSQDIGLAYTVVSEWGRTPEEAQKIGEGASSLKGMVCVVPKGAPEADLVGLGKVLRTTFAEFENINIDVLDDLDAARAFVEKNEPPSEHRVLSISKHQRSGRDLIIVNGPEGVKEIPFEP